MYPQAPRKLLLVPPLPKSVTHISAIQEQGSRELRTMYSNLEHTTGCWGGGVGGL